MSYIMVDVAADGPNPGDYSMVCFGAIVVDPPRRPRERFSFVDGRDRGR
jgi:hypothetical protein